MTQRKKNNHCWRINISYPLLVISQQSLLMSCLEHYNLRKGKQHLYTLIKAALQWRWNYDKCMLILILITVNITLSCPRGNCLFFTQLCKMRHENEQTLLISVKCLLATVLMSENRALTSELPWKNTFTFHQQQYIIHWEEIKSRIADAYFVGERW